MIDSRPRESHASDLHGGSLTDLGRTVDEALYHVGDADNKRTIRGMGRSVVQFNSDGLDHSHRHRGRAGFQCLLLLVYLDPVFSRCLNTPNYKGRR